MRQFLIALLAVLVGACVVVFLYDRHVAQPRQAELLERLSVVPDLTRLLEQAQQVATGVETSVQRSVALAQEAMDAQASEADLRAIVVDAMQRTGMFRAALAEYYMNWGRWPENPADAGLPGSADSSASAGHQIHVGQNGRISVLFDGHLSEGSRIELTPRVDDPISTIEWACVLHGDPVLKRTLSRCEARP